MKCEICQERLASLHLTNYINGKKTEVHLCPVCAKENGYIDAEEETYTIHDLLSGFFNINPNLTEESGVNEQRNDKLSCPKCGMTYQQFSKTGKFGCSKCYQTFGDYLDPIFRRVHGGNTEHTGKIPKRQYVYLQHKRQIRDYRDQLQQLVKEEKFEQAAVLRDKIKELEQKENPAESKGDDA